MSETTANEEPAHGPLPPSKKYLRRARFMCAEDARDSLTVEEERDGSVTIAVREVNQDGTCRVVLRRDTLDELIEVLHAFLPDDGEQEF